MAHLRPILDGLHTTGLGQQREVDMLRTLADGLPDDYAVFHGVC